MGRAVELITASRTAPGSSFGAAAAVSGDSLTIRDTQSKVRIVSVWQQRQSSGGTRVTSPLIHDNQVGMSWSLTRTGVCMLMMPPAHQVVRGQDTLTVQISGSATAGDIESSSMLMVYDDLPGVDGRYINMTELLRRMVNIYVATNTLSLGTSGGYSGSESIVSEQDAMKANTDYAILGYTLDASCCSIRYQGPDLGNLGVGGPGLGNIEFSDITSRWFTHLAEATGLPTIPVINSSNKSLTLISGAQDENGAEVTVSTIYGELRRG